MVSSFLFKQEVCNMAVPNIKGVPTPAKVNNALLAKGTAAIDPNKIAAQSVPAPTQNGASFSGMGKSLPKGDIVPKPLFNQATESVANSALTIPQGGNVPKPPAQPYSNPQLADWSAKQQELFKQWEEASNKPFQYDPIS